MKKDTPKYRQSPRNLGDPDNSLKILNLGVCLERACFYFDSKADHYHGLAYTKGLSSIETVAKAEKVLRSIGFEGQLEVETISNAEFKKRASGKGSWL